MLYTTVTVSDFRDIDYINKLRELGVGMELAFLTKLPDRLEEADFEKDLNALKEELAKFIWFFEKFNIPLQEIRLHQPGGYTYNWSSKNEQSGFDVLKAFFIFCYGMGFRHYVIHSPYGNSNINADPELNDYRDKLLTLIPQAHLEVEEISVSFSELEKHQSIRCYSGILFEKLMEDQKATMLLDTHECGGIDATIRRMKYLQSKGFEIRSIHTHKNKHKFLTINELELLLKTGFRGNIINEGFLKSDSSFDEFVETKSMNCVVPNNQRIDILTQYKEQMNYRKRET